MGRDPSRPRTRSEGMEGYRVTKTKNMDADRGCLSNCDTIRSYERKPWLPTEHRKVAKQRLQESSHATIGGRRGRRGGGGGYMLP